MIGQPIPFWVRGEGRLGRGAGLAQARAIKDILMWWRHQTTSVELDQEGVEPDPHIN
jgi:hypothetical protein